MAICTCTSKQKRDRKPSIRCEAHPGYIPKPPRRQTGSLADSLDSLKETLDALYNETAGKTDSPWIRSVKQKAAMVLKKAGRL